MPPYLCRAQLKHRQQSSSRAAFVTSKAARVVAAKGVQKETEWEGEFAPGHRLAKRLQSESVQGSPSGSSTSSTSSFDSLDEEYDFHQGQPAASHGLFHKLLGHFWDDLPARYKLVFATSMAFVLCNMVSICQSALRCFLMHFEKSICYFQESMQWLQFLMLWKQFVTLQSSQQRCKHAIIAYMIAFPPE